MTKYRCNNNHQKNLPNNLYKIIYFGHSIMMESAEEGIEIGETITNIIFSDPAMIAIQFRQ